MCACRVGVKDVQLTSWSKTESYLCANIGCLSSSPSYRLFSLLRLTDGHGSGRWKHAGFLSLISRVLPSNICRPGDLAIRQWILDRQVWRAPNPNLEHLMRLGMQHHYTSLVQCTTRYHKPLGIWYSPRYDITVDCISYFQSGPPKY